MQTIPVTMLSTTQAILGEDFHKRRQAAHKSLEELTGRFWASIALGRASAALQKLYELDDIEDFRDLIEALREYEQELLRRPVTELDRQQLSELAHSADELHRELVELIRTIGRAP
ncbi:hypothetical protein [Chitinimonas lacunae]|uniref:Uncharacterized protein n=1 Tax=Chitinimonas lacunae TaxID=1963018 RepID=A0ABV8MYZ1_9NEIS